MATNRDLLKEAIADAKAVKEMAIANAKAALEESFTPQLKSMLSAKLNEMEELEDDDLPVTEMYLEAKKEDELEEDLDLEALLNELNENEEEETEETDEESEESEESEEEGEPLDLENMTDEDLKKMIEDVIADMMGSGELEMEKSEDETMKMEPEDEEINLDELLAEIASLEEDEYEEEYEAELEEGKVWDYIKSVASGIASSFSKNVEGWDEFQKDPRFEEFTKKYISTETGAIDPDKAASPEYRDDVNRLGSYYQNWLIRTYQLDPGVARNNMNDFKESLGLLVKRGKQSGELSADISTKVTEELEEAYSTIESLRKDLNEVNLLNAKLLYTNKIFKAKNLTESQKVNVLGMFDKATNVGEVKLVFETLSEGLKAKPSPIKENLGSASKTLGTTKSKQPIVESNDMVARFQKLAGIIKD